MQFFVSFFMQKYCSSYRTGIFVLYLMLTFSGVIPVLRVECPATLAENPRAAGRCDCNDEEDEQTDCCTKNCCNRTWEISGHETDDALPVLSGFPAVYDYQSGVFILVKTPMYSPSAVVIPTNGLLTHSPPGTINRSILFQTLII